MSIVGYRHGDVITGEHDQIRAESVDNLYPFADGHNGKSFVIVEITDVSNGEPIELGRKPSQTNVESRHLGAIRIDKANGTSDSGPGSKNSASEQKFSSGQQAGAEWKGMNRTLILIDGVGLCGTRFLARNIDAQVEHERNHRQIDQEDGDVKKAYFVSQTIDLIG